MTPEWGDEDLLVPFAARVIGCRADFANCRTMGVYDRDGNVAAAVIFHNWSPEAGVMEVTCAAVNPRWATRGVLREGFDYIFNRAGCQMAVARTDEGNSAVRRLWKAFGASEYVIPRLRGRSASEAILCLTQEAWAASPFMR